MAERIGFAQFVNLVEVSLERPMVERIIILVHRSIIIHALEEGVVGRNGEGAYIFHGTWQFAYDGHFQFRHHILIVLLLVFSIHFGSWLIFEGYASLVT